MSLLGALETTRSRYPSCCGSEDGDLTYGVDPAERGQYAIVTAWLCNTCGTITIVSATTTGEPPCTPRP